MSASTVVVSLNSNPTGISADRLERIKSKTALYQNNPKETANRDQLSLFDDVAIYEMDWKKVILGWVIRMRNQAKSTVEYRKPISLDKIEKYPKLKILCNRYLEKNDQYCYGTKSSLEEYSVKDVITKARLEIQDSGKYVLDVNDSWVLEEFLQNITKKRTQRKRRNGEQKDLEMSSPVAGRVIRELISLPLNTKLSLSCNN